MARSSSPLKTETDAVNDAAKDFAKRQQLGKEQVRAAEALAKESLALALGSQGGHDKQSVALLEAQLKTAFLHQMANPATQAGQALNNPQMHAAVTEAVARNIQKTMLPQGQLDFSQASIGDLQTNPRQLQKQIGKEAAFQAGKANAPAIVSQFSEEDLMAVGLSQNALRRGLTERAWIQGKREGVENAGQRLRGERQLESFELAEQNMSQGDRDMRLADQGRNERMLEVQEAVLGYAQSYNPETGQFGAAQKMNLDYAKQKLAAEQAHYQEAEAAYIQQRSDFYGPKIEAALRENFGDQFSESQIKAASAALNESVIRDQDPVLQTWPMNDHDADVRVQMMMDNARKELAAGNAYQKEDGTSLTNGANPEADSVANLVYAARGAKPRNEAGTVAFDIMGRSEASTNRMIEQAVVQQTLAVQNAPKVEEGLEVNEAQNIAQQPAVAANEANVPVEQELQNDLNPPVANHGVQRGYDSPSVLASGSFNLAANENKSAQQASETYTLRAAGNVPVGANGETLAFAKPQFNTGEYQELKQQQDSLQTRITQIESGSQPYKDWNNLKRELEVLPVDLQRAQNELAKTQATLAQMELTGTDQQKADWRKNLQDDQDRVDRLLTKQAQLPQLEQQLDVMSNHPDVLEHAAKTAEKAAVDQKVNPMISAAEAAAPLYNDVAAMQNPAIGGDRSMLTRSVASYQVDQLLGTNVVAEEKMAQAPDGRLMGVSVQVDGAQIAGKHQGKDCYLQADYSDPRIQKGLADLEAVDYITGQIDRHHGNIFVHPETGKVTGIDNDLAFPERDRNVMLSKDGALREKAVQGMPKQMSRDTADKILSITPEKLAAELGKISNPDGSGKLSEAEVQGAVQRLQELQAAIKDPNSGMMIVSEFNQQTYEAAVTTQKQGLIAEKSAKGVDIEADANRADFKDIDFASDLNQVSKTSYLGAAVMQGRTYELQNGQIEEGVEFGLRDPASANNKAQVNPEFAAYKRAEQSAKKAMGASPELIDNHVVRQQVIEANRDLAGMKAKLDDYQKQLDKLAHPSTAEKAKALLTHGGVDNARDRLVEKKAEVLQQMKAKQEQLDKALDKAVEPMKTELYLSAREAVAAGQQRQAGPAPRVEVPNAPVVAENAPGVAVQNQPQVPAHNAPVVAAQNGPQGLAQNEPRPRAGSVADSLRSSHTKHSVDGEANELAPAAKQGSVGRVSKLTEKFEQAIKDQGNSVSGPKKKAPAPGIGST